MYMYFHVPFALQFNQITKFIEGASTDKHRGRLEEMLIGNKQKKLPLADRKQTGTVHEDSEPIDIMRSI